MNCTRKESNYYSELVNLIEHYQNENVKYSIIEKEISIDVNHFNIAQYFSLFDKLILEEGYRLKLCYVNYGKSGFPKIFSVKDDKQIDSTSIYSTLFYQLNDSINILNEEIYFNNYSFVDSLLNPMNHLKIEDSKKGYFQFLIIYLIGDNFALFWHSNYGNNSLILSKKSLDDILKSKNNFINLNNNQKNEAKKINPSPKITMKKDTCYIRIINFSPWKGFESVEYGINRKFPHKVKYLSCKILVEYDCGIMF